MPPGTDPLGGIMAASPDHALGRSPLLSRLGFGLTNSPQLSSAIIFTVLIRQAAIPALSLKGKVDRGFLSGEATER